MNNERIDSAMAEKILQGDDTDPDILQSLGLEILAELKKCYEEIDKVTQMVADFSNRCEQAEYTDVGEVWDLLDTLMKNLASE